MANTTVRQSMSKDSDMIFIIRGTIIISDDPIFLSVSYKQSNLMIYIRINLTKEKFIKNRIKKEIEMGKSGYYWSFLEELNDLVIR